MCRRALPHVGLYLRNSSTREHRPDKRHNDGSISFGGTNCSDNAIDQRLSWAIAAHARGVPLHLYFEHNN